MRLHYGFAKKESKGRINHSCVTFAQKWMQKKPHSK